jgi:hypothetical protein
MSVYDTSTLGASDNQLTFNGTILPIYRVVSRAPQQRQLRQLDIPIPFEDGVSDFQTLEGSSAYIISGIMYPGSEQDYDNGLAALRKLSSLDIEQADNNTDDGYVPYVFKEYSQSKQIFVKVLYVDVPESTRKGLVQPFRLVCKVKDPTIFSNTTAIATTQGTDPTTSGGSALFPFGFPILFGASTYSASSVATNTGDLDGYPISIKVYGPINSPTVTNATTGEFITVNTNVASGSTLTIAYNKDSLSVDVDGVSMLNQVTSTSTYFKLKRGTNNITLNGQSFSSGAYVVVTYYQGYWPLS